MLSAYTAVVATQLGSCWQLNIPCFLVQVMLRVSYAATNHSTLQPYTDTSAGQTNGMVGCQFKEHTVIESKPEANSFDHRLSMVALS